MSPATDVEVLIVGAGISGIGAAIELIRRRHTSFVLVERDSALGGTWRDNTYPGVAVDIPSASYCFSFESDFPWSNTFAAGGEIQEYVRHCAEKWRVTPHIRYGTNVVRTEFDTRADRWTTTLGDGTYITSRFVIAATGVFGAPKIPDFSGLQRFAGTIMHSGRWDHAHDVTAKRVAVIGTGASAVQIVPAIAPRVATLTVFQRTPIWVAPRGDAPVGRRSPRRWRIARAVLRAVSESRIELLTFLVVNYRRTRPVVHFVQRAIRRWMRRQVRDPDTAAALIPAYGLGCKRPAVSDTYLATFNRDNVSLVTRPIARITPDAIVTDDGIRYATDTIVLATGFRTTERGNAPTFDVVGRAGVELGAWWETHRRQSYAGVSIPGFPNFFITAGPYSGGFNWFAMLEANLAHIMWCLDEARARRVTRVETRAVVHDRYMAHVWRRANDAVFQSESCIGSNSYYLDRHGDASLPQPHTPWWRVLNARRHRTRGYAFGSGAM